MIIARTLALLVVYATAVTSCFSQSNTVSITMDPPQTAELEISKTIQSLFDGMRQGDSNTLITVFEPRARLITVQASPKKAVSSMSASEFIKRAGVPHSKIWDEQISNLQISAFGPMATATMDYHFYYGEELLHCGVNAMHLGKGPKGWRILHLTDTRDTSDCDHMPGVEIQIDSLLNQWHRAAAAANYSAFFDAMTPAAVYIGTDAGERWTKNEFAEWCKPYFARGKAWDFKPYDRHIQLAKNGKMAWADEMLNTWMGPCRGSAVLEKSAKGQWKIAHYHLSVTVPNEKIKAFISLMNQNTK